MPNVSFQHDSGKYLTAVSAVNPQSAAAGAVNGNTVDRTGFTSGKLIVQTGATSGAPTAFTVDVKLQESADGSTWSDVSPAVTVPTVSTADSVASVDIDLSGLLNNVRAVATVGFTGGTSPAVNVGSVLVLGGDDRLNGA